MELNEKKTKYFVIGIVLLILLGIVLIVHFNNKSLVSGDKDKKSEEKKTTEVKTTEVKTTKKSNIVKQVSNVKEENNNNVYKSTVDETNKIIYNFKLTNEILDNDKLVSKKLDINEYLKNNNVIGLYDISLYSSDNIKKSVNNSLINISIPLNSDLIGYDEYKVVYVNDNGIITDETFETSVKDGYIKFSTTHLSMYAIVGIKNKTEEIKPAIDLSKVTVDVLQNGNIVKDQSVVASVNDIIDIKVNNITSEYKVYYALKNDINKDNLEYKEFISGTILNSNTPNKVVLTIKVVSQNTEKVFDLNEFNIYDVVYNYDKNNEIKDETNPANPDGVKNVGEVKENYENVDDNQNIVVKDITGDNVTIDPKKEATININGNAYLVDKTDISNMKFNGYLVIDTDKQIIFKNNIDMTNLYQITIISKEFNFNGIKYTYEIVDGKIIIKKITEKEIIDEKEESKKTEEIVSEDDFNKNFDGEVKLDIDKDNNLVIKKKETDVKDDPKPLQIDQNPEEITE